MTDSAPNPTSGRQTADGTTVTWAVGAAVTAAASKLVAATAGTSAQISQQVLAELVTHFDADVGFLRYNDHRIGASTLVAEWPPRLVVPDPDPLAVVYFADTDPMFAHCAHATKTAVFRAQPGTRDHRRALTDPRSAAASSSTAAVPLVSGDITTGTLGFIRFGDRRWQHDELHALTAAASLFAQTQARIVAEEELRHLANHDDLTGLYNRRGFLAHLSERLSRHERVTVLYLDLDRLKNVNDDLGHAAGDDVLRAAAHHLRRTLRPGDVLARLGGDEFVASLVTPITTLGIGKLTARIHDALAQPILIEGAHLCIGASIGVVVADHHDPARILRDADAAMYAAKNTCRGTTHYVACATDAESASPAGAAPRQLVTVDPNQPENHNDSRRACRSDVVDQALINQAIGIIRSRSGVTADEARAELNRTSEEAGSPLTLVAHHLVEDAVLRAQTTASPT